MEEKRKKKEEEMKTSFKSFLWPSAQKEKPVIGRKLGMGELLVVWTGLKKNKIIIPKINHLTSGDKKKLEKHLDKQMLFRD